MNAASNETGPVSAPRDLGTTAPSSGPRLLFVDDESSLRGLEGLRGSPGIPGSWMWASDRVRARAVLGNDRVDVVVSDLELSDRVFENLSANADRFGEVEQTPQIRVRRK